MRTTRETILGLLGLVMVVGLVLGGLYLLKHHTKHGDESAGLKTLSPAPGAESAAEKDPRQRVPTSTAKKAKDERDQEPVSSQKMAVALPDDPDVDAAVLASIARLKASNGALCEQKELAGDGPERTVVSPGDWAKVMRLFDDSKARLLSWLKKKEKSLPKDLVHSMAERVRSLKIQRPPAPEEPELNWRGIGILTRDVHGEPLVRMGSGFMKLILANEERGRFELTRLIAQAWAPCELRNPHSARGLASPPILAWGAVLECLGVHDLNACEEGSYSEEGWASATALAAAVANPGCTIPAFQFVDSVSCLSRFGESKPVGWKEARR